MAFEFNKCCFCIELRTGCLIIGYLNLIAEIIVILFGIIGLAAAGVVSSGAVDDKDMSQDAKQQVHAMGALMFGLIVFMMIIFILFLAFTIVLLVGLHQHKRGHIKAYLIFALIFIVLSILQFFASFGGEFTAGSIIQNLLTILLSIYFLLVIRSYYLKMDNPANKPAIYNTA